MAGIKQWHLPCVFLIALGIAPFLIASSDRQKANSDGGGAVTVAGGVASTKIIPFQGRLTDLSDAPLSGQHDLLFSLYFAADAVSPIWQELHTGVQVVGGRFSVLLGSTTLFDDPDGNPSTPDAVDFSVPIYVGVKVGTGTEMRPRKQIVPAIHSFHATTADHSHTTSDSLLLEGRSWGELTPPGTIVAFAGPVAPQGWLLCDGQIVNRLTYSELFSAIGTAWGNGDDVSTDTFRVPDLRGRFLRGVDNPQGSTRPGVVRDPNHGARIAIETGGNTGDMVGSLQDGQFSWHSHAVTDPGHAHAFTKWWGQTGVADNNPCTHCQHALSSVVTTSLATTGISIEGSGGSETRPVNAYVTYIIKH